jgi:hypothetical protein
MNRPRDEEHGQGSAYTCLLWNVKSGQPTVVTIRTEHHDRWIAQRCVVTQSSFEAPVEMFMKSDWQREEPQAQASPEGGAADPAAASKMAAQGAGALIAGRGFHPTSPPPTPAANPAPVPPARAAGGARKAYGFHP